MKLLFDENAEAPIKGARQSVAKAYRRTGRIYPGSPHVAEFDLLERPDREIRDFAQASGFIIVTADADFYELAAALGPPTKVIWRITEFAADSVLGILVSIAGSNPSAFQADSFQQVSPLPFMLRTAEELVSGVWPVPWATA